MSNDTPFALDRPAIKQVPLAKRLTEGRGGQRLYLPPAAAILARRDPAEVRTRGAAGGDPSRVMTSADCWWKTSCPSWCSTIAASGTSY